MKPVNRPEESLYLACSGSVTSGDTASADLIPAILSIIFEKCQTIGWITDYLLVDASLTPEPLTPIDVRLESDVEDHVYDDDWPSDYATIGDDSSYKPDSGS
jgi:hypothetical protein